MNMFSTYEFDANSPSFFEDVFPNNWQMTRWEKFAFISLVQKFQPEIAVEIGNAQGGSLQVLSKVCKKVYALDLGKEVHDKLRPQFNNVEFHTGDSKQILPGLLKQMQERNEKIGFVLIDGDHSTEGVKADINAFLHHYTPLSDMLIIFHDSFNPVCRQGIIEADWAGSPYVHYVDIDFMPGNFFKDAYKSAEKGSMWGGISLAYLKQEKRENELVIRQSLQPMYNVMFRNSRYNALKYKARVFFEKLRNKK